ncbi:MAG: hypothetical protein V5A18_06915 [Haloarculaceae archaeon]
MTAKEFETQRVSTVRDKFYLPAQASDGIVRRFRALLPTRARGRR